MRARTPEQHQPTSGPSGEQHQPAPRRRHAQQEPPRPPLPRPESWLRLRPCWWLRNVDDASCGRGSAHSSHCAPELALMSSRKNRGAQLQGTATWLLLLSPASHVSPHVDAALAAALLGSPFCSQPTASAASWPSISAAVSSDTTFSLASSCCDIPPGLRFLRRRGDVVVDVGAERGRSGVSCENTLSS